jgi:hypothetical protein
MEKDYKSSFDHTVSQEINIDEERELDNNFNKFLFDIKSNLAKCKYRKVIEDIETTEDIFINCRHSWKIKELKIRSMLKIANRKIIKSNDPSGSNFNSNNIAREIETWLTRIDDEIDKLNKEIQSNLACHEMNDEIEMMVDISVQLLLENIYLCALFYKNDKNMDDCCAALSFGRRVIRDYVDYSKDPRTLNIAQKIYLFISSCLIGDSDFDNARSYLTMCLNLCFKELFMRVDILEGLNFTNLSKSQVHYFYKIFLNISIAFYQRGACEEYMGSTVRAIESYKQSRWFVMKFVYNTNPELAQFICDVEKRALKYDSMIKNIKEKAEIQKLKAMKVSGQENNLKLISDEKKINLARIAEGNYINLSKHDKTKHIIENLKFQELEYEANRRLENHKSKDVILSTVHLVDTLMSDEFRDLIKNMKNMEVNKMDKETHEILQKKITEVRVEKNYLRKSEENIKESKSNLLRESSAKELTKESFRDPDNKIKIYTKHSIFAQNKFNSNQKLRDSEITFSSNNVNNLNSNQTKSTQYMSNAATMKRSFLISESTNKLTPTITTATGTNFFNSKVNSIYSSDNHNSTKKILPVRAKSSMSKRLNTGEVEKFTFDEFVFNPKCKGKIDYLHRINNKEIIFQKQLLKLKKCEKIIIDEVKEQNIKQLAEVFYKRGISHHLNRKIESQVKKADFMQGSVFAKNEKVKENLVNQLIMSQNPAKLKKLKTMMITKDKPEIDIKNIMTMNSTQDENLIDATTVNKKNNEIWKDVEEKLEELEKEQLYFNNMINYEKYKNKNNSQKNTKTRGVNNIKNMDGFVKIHTASPNRKPF